MKDLYKQLGVGESGSEEEIRAALGGAGSELREAAGFVLLDPSRRAVYDRNRRVLVTVGRLRAHLGLNLTRFWPRSRFADFTIDPVPLPREGGGPPIDPMRMAWAFGVAPPGERRSRRPGRRAKLLAVAFALAAGLSAAVWYWTHAS